MKWLITGGAGFIGCHCAKQFLARGDEVVVVDNLSRRGAEANLDWLRQQGLTEFIDVDVRSQDSMAEAFRQHLDTDVVLHLAAQVAVTSSVQSPRNDFEINALGTLNVLEAVRTMLRGRATVIYSSTNKVYGDLAELPLRELPTRYELPGQPDGIAESQPLDFHSPYGCSKGAGDQYVRDYARIFGLKTVVIRQSCIYGTRQFGVEDQGWIAWFTIAAATGSPITIYGNGKQVRDVLWIDDLADLYERAARQIDRVAGEVFNIGGGSANSLSLVETLNWLQTAIGTPIRPAMAEARPGDQRYFVADIRKAARMLDWTPQVAPTVGLARLLDWVLKHRELLTACESAT